MERFLKMGGLLSAMAIITGCSTPRETCIAAATSEYNNAKNEISETSQNISRGYAVHTQRVPYTYQGTCYDYYTTSYYNCPQTGYRTDETPVSIDTGAEKAKLSKLKKQLPKYEAQASAGIKQCVAMYPDT
ncbi:hypothetical protein [Pseudopelagicola sp. nBUS_19]|uniref:hypothetical protein n=1 Tax=unclassified Pseudopelagicola TaxID=2649563 RepID=UPI003EC093ED